MKDRFELRGRLPLNQRYRIYAMDVSKILLNAGTPIAFGSFLRSPQVNTPCIPPSQKLPPDTSALMGQAISHEFQMERTV